MKPSDRGRRRPDRVGLEREHLQLVLFEQDAQVDLEHQLELVPVGVSPQVLAHRLVERAPDLGPDLASPRCAGAGSTWISKAALMLRPPGGR